MEISKVAVNRSGDYAYEVYVDGVKLDNVTHIEYSLFPMSIPEVVHIHIRGDLEYNGEAELHIKNDS